MDEQFEIVKNVSIDGWSSEPVDILALENKELSDRELIFVKEYIIDFNASRAYRQAGYSASNNCAMAHYLKQRPHVAKAIQGEMDKRAIRLEVTQDNVLRDILEVKNRCMQRSPVFVKGGVQAIDEDGNHIWTFNSKGALTALELIGKHLGMFVNKVQLSGLNGGPIEIESKKTIDLSGLTDEELEALERIARKI